MFEKSYGDKRWPAYHDVPKEATFALGVIGAQYARLEWAFSGLFAATTGIPTQFVLRLLPKIGNDVRVALIEETLPDARLGEQTEACVVHFLTAYKSLAFNRNMLMHSHIVGSGATTSILFKTQRDGQTVGCQLSVPQLRQIADDMETYRNFAMALANGISLERTGIQLFVVSDTLAGHSPSPDKPPQPSRLEYTSGPFDFR